MMSAKSFSKPLRGALWVAGLGIVVVALGIALYAVRIQASADALISSARRIHTTADAEREIANWKRRGGQRFWLESDHPGGDHNYDGQVDNVPLSRLGLVEPTNIVFSVTTNRGKLRCITLAMYTEAHRNSPSGVWIQEWFDSDEPKSPRVSANGKLSRL